MTGAGDAVPDADEPAWQRNRRLRLAQIEAETEHGRQIAERYGSGPVRQVFAVVGHLHGKRRRR